MTNITLEETVEAKPFIAEGKEGMLRGIAREIKNYAIDTSAKVASYTPIMATLEAVNGMNANQIVKSRAVMALIDTAAARVCGKALDYTREKFHSEKSALRGYLVDTLTMIGVYGPIYAGVLALNGADSTQITHGVTMMSAVAAATARPYGKYVLNKWRKHCGYSK